MTDNKELIPGMNDIMNHIKKLEKENKELKEVNKTLNNYNEANIKLRQEREDENNILRDLLQNRMPATCIAETTYQPILDENEKLKEQNNKLLLKETKTHNENVSLKSEIKELKEERDGEAEYIIETKIEDGDLFTNIYVKNIEEQLEANIKLRQEKEDEIQELEEDLKPLNDEMSGMTGVCDYKDVVDYINADRAIIKELKEQQKWFEEKNGNGISVAIKELNEEVEQNQKWFEEINELIGAKSEDPSVVAVAEYVKGMKIVDNELSKARKYERFLEYKLEQENIDYLIPDNYEEKDYDGSSEEEDN